MSLERTDYEEKAREAVKAFWSVRSAAAQKQIGLGKSDQGERQETTGGKHMDGFIRLLEIVARENGIAQADIYANSVALTLPGFYRPTKKWDLLIKHKGSLVAVIETKGQGGSTGKNSNNRVEEIIGNATDFWAMTNIGVYGKQPRPFLGYLMFVVDSEVSRKGGNNHMSSSKISPHYEMLSEFQGANYLQRYNILCKKLVSGGLYTAAAIITSTKEAGQQGQFEEISETTGLRKFINALAEHVAAEVARLDGSHSDTVGELMSQEADSDQVLSQ
jgi:hypothetical protein